MNDQAREYIHEKRREFCKVGIIFTFFKEFEYLIGEELSDTDKEVIIETLMPYGEE
jgi:hypothetical protein